MPSLPPSCCSECDWCEDASVLGGGVGEMTV